MERKIPTQEARALQDAHCSQRAADSWREATPGISVAFKKANGSQPMGLNPLGVHIRYLYYDLVL